MSSFDLGGGGNSFAFDNIGDSVTGKITVIEEVQQTDMESGQPAVWDNGQPKMMVRVELATDLREPTDPADDGKRSVYLKGSRKPESASSMAAVLGAVQQATGSRALQSGGTLTLTFAGEGVPSRRGYSAPKQYTASYVAPAVDLGGGQAAPQQAPAHQPPPAQPVQQQAPAPVQAPPVQQPAPQQAPVQAQPAPQQDMAAMLAAMTPEQQASLAAFQQQQGQPQG